MSDNPDNREAPLVKIAKAVGPILGIPLALFAIVTSIAEQPLIALVVALITAVLASVGVVRSGWTGIIEMSVAWLALIVLVLAGFVIWPRTMTVEGTIRDTAGNPVSNEVLVLFDHIGKRYESKTNSEGDYQFIEVPTGRYVVRVRRSEIEGEAKGILVRVVQQNLTVPETLAAASPTPMPTEVPSPTPLSSPTHTTAPSPTATDTPTPIPTETPSPRPTPSETPSPKPVPTSTPTPMLAAPPTGIIGESGVHCTSNGSGGTEILAVEPPRTVAQIRIDMRRRATEYGNSLWEVEAYGLDTGDTNLVTCGRANASSVQNDVNCKECFASKAIDGKRDTRWSSDWYDPQVLTITLPTPQIANQIVLKWETAFASEYCVTVTEPITAALEPIPCPYQADTDEDTIVQLIWAESEAVSCGNISTIQAIFAEDALIRNAVNDEEWHDPIARYRTLFANLDFRDLIHFDILPAGPGITETVAYFTSGNRGQYRGSDGKWQPLENKSSLDPSTPYGSDHWTLEKNDAGCWAITEFTFNAGHIPFP